MLVGRRRIKGRWLESSTHGYGAVCARAFVRARQAVGPVASRACASVRIYMITF
jgi:hypothetical protein